MIGGLFTVLVLTLATGQSSPQEKAPISVGVHMPLVFFVGTEEKAAFLTGLENAVSEALGRPAIASFLSSQKDLATNQLLVLDAAAAATQDKLLVISRARGSSGGGTRVSVYARRKWKSVYELLTKGSVVIPRGQERELLRYWLLLDEPNSAVIAKRVKSVRDARSALMAVAAGETDGAIVPTAKYKDLEPRFAALEELNWLRELPLPVFAINRRVVGADEASRWTPKLRTARLQTVKGVISGWEPARSTADLVLLGQALSLRRSPIGRTLVLAPLPPFHVFLGDLMPPPPEATPLAPVLVMPPRRFAPLPDPPTVEKPKPAVSLADSSKEARRKFASVEAQP